jgi:hypothetical protein
MFTKLINKIIFYFKSKRLLKKVKKKDPFIYR